MVAWTERVPACMWQTGVAMRLLILHWSYSSFPGFFMMKSEQDSGYIIIHRFRDCHNIKSISIVHEKYNYTFALAVLSTPRYSIVTWDLSCTWPFIYTSIFTVNPWLAWPCGCLFKRMYIIIIMVEINDEHYCCSMWLDTRIPNIVNIVYLSMGSTNYENGISRLY